MRTLLFVALLGASAVTGCSKSSDSSSEKAETEKLAALTVDEVAAKIATPDGKTFIFDDNDKKTYAAGHVPGAKWLDEENVTAADLPADKAATLIFYCHSET
jgi:3-mercaptopyruvate sulfurtransferase SseA